MLQAGLHILQSHQLRERALLLTHRTGRSRSRTAAAARAPCPRGRRPAADKGGIPVARKHYWHGPAGTCPSSSESKPPGPCNTFRRTGAKQTAGDSGTGLLCCCLLPRSLPQSHGCYCRGACSERHSEWKRPCPGQLAGITTNSECFFCCYLRHLGCGQPRTKQLLACAHSCGGKDGRKWLIEGGRLGALAPTWRQAMQGGRQDGMLGGGHCATHSIASADDCQCSAVPSGNQSMWHIAPHAHLRWT